MRVENGKLANGRHTPRHEQARALAVILEEEFGAPFAFHDAGTGNLVWGDAGAEALDPALREELLRDGRALVNPEGPRRYRVALLLYEAGRPSLVAVARLEALAEPGPVAAREETRLRKWLQAVGERLRLSEQAAGHRQSEETYHSQAAAAWETILQLDQVLRRLRIHKDPERSRRRLLDAAFGRLRAQALAWVPQQLDAAVSVQGEARLAEPDLRRLAAALAQHSDPGDPQPILCNDVQGRPWGPSFPHVHSLLAFPVTDQGPAGWVIALNKQGEPPAFRRSDAALLTPFVAALELHARAAERYRNLKELLVGLTRSLTAALDAKDSYTFGHSERVARIAIELGRELGLPEDELGDIYLAGLLHDVGKIGIRDSVLRKAGPLTPDEFEHVKQHVTIGYRILADLRPIRNLLPGVLHHHEHYDGSGYPDGLAGEAIPLMARILAVADAYDAMSTARPYREAMPCRRVEEILVQGAGVQWDRRVVEAFQRCRQKIHAIRQRGVGESLNHAIDGALRTEESSVVGLLQPSPGSMP